MLEIRHLKTIKAIAQLGTLAKAADWLNTSSSALSHQLKDIEGRIGNPLFIRKTNPVQLTAEGQVLLELADQVLPALSNTEQKLHELKQGNKGRLRLAIECHSCFQWLMPAISQFKQRWPLVDIEFNNDFMFDALPGLEEGQLDLVITADKYPSDLLHFEPLFNFEMLLVTSPNHKLAKRNYIEPKDLQSENLLVYPVANNRLDVFKHFLNPVNTQPKSVKKVDQTLMILQMVTADMGVAVLPNWAVHEYESQNLIATASLGKDGVQSELFAAIKRRDKSKGYIQSFFEISRQTSVENLPQVTLSTSSE
ncbi:LysR family transcriptional regulator [Saccharobesus litoralis]|uniref:HTH-type transcriptional regulator MetR n=1 Tax=Saccharobesus litoralis TaxID=2172099 RepID=A0A2S0VSP2_9ALTE|nr:LysR substrate-binding domain-containing protein [Saccharobesus litoralis]AWB67203.1 LysR family transcriptional regulator [Saccharobesus litoralis]